MNEDTAMVNGWILHILGQQLLDVGQCVMDPDTMRCGTRGIMACCAMVRDGIRYGAMSSRVDESKVGRATVKMDLFPLILPPSGLGNRLMVVLLFQ